MNRDQIIAALDAAFADHLSKLFDVLAVGTASDPSASLVRFAKGLSNAKAAYASARAEIERAS